MWRYFTNWRGNPQEHEEHEEHKRGETLKLTITNHTYARSKNTQEVTKNPRKTKERYKVLVHPNPMRKEVLMIL